MTKVFISHASGDREFVEREIIPALRDHKIDTWNSTDDIPTAAHWDRKILEGLKVCDWFVVVLTPRSVASEWVRAEVHWAMENRQGRIVPVLAEECDWGELYLKLNLIQFVRFEAGSDKFKERLLMPWKESMAASTASSPPSPPAAEGTARTEQGETPPEAIQPHGPNLDSPLSPGHLVRPIDPQVDDTRSGDGSAAFPASDSRRASSELSRAELEAGIDAMDSVHQALAASNLQIEASNYGAPWVREGNLGTVWRSLYDALKGKEIPELRRIIFSRRGRDQTALHIRALGFLKCSLRMQEGKPYAREVFPQLLCYDVYEPWDPSIKQAVDSAIDELAVLPAEKTEMIFAFLPSGDGRRVSDYLRILPRVTPGGLRERTRMVLVTLLKTRIDLPIGAFVAAFKELTPADKREETAALLLERLEESPDFIDGSCLRLFRDWRLAAFNPRLRRLIPMVVNSSVINLTRYLADWKDPDAEADIREVVERYRYGGEGHYLNSVMADLLAVACGDTDEYIAEVLQTAAPGVQKILLAGSIKKSRSKVIMQAVAELSVNSRDSDVQQAAAECLGMDISK